MAGSLKQDMWPVCMILAVGLVLGGVAYGAGAPELIVCQAGGESAAEPGTESGPKQVGVLIIFSTPSGATLHIIDRSKEWLAPWGLNPEWTYLGKTPYRNSSMPEGKYWVRAESEGKDEIIGVTVEAGKEVKEVIMFPMIGQGGRGDYGGP